MLQIKIPDVEFYDESTNRFFTRKGCVLTMEHSLISVSKWESKWHVPFLAGKKLSLEQTLDYYRCMTITQNVDPEVYNNLDKNTADKIEKYINDPMTATWFSNTPSEHGDDRSIITSEIIYYQMITLGIPFECEKWHLNRLITLIRVVSIKNSPPKKMGREEVLRMQAQLNAERKAKLNTKG